AGHIRREHSDLSHELGLLAEFYGPAAAEAGITLALEPGPPVQAGIDRPLFQRAVGNLVENALKYTPPGGRIALRAGAEPKGATVEVEDNGMGMPEEAQERVFERFHRADPARPRSSGGTGLGLAIVKGIMTLHGGSASLESRIGAGTRVKLRFPA
ncbi:MAG: sensor histidine kinase, partial [bacterium]